MYNHARDVWPQTAGSGAARLSIETVTSLITNTVGAVAVLGIFLTLIVSGRLHTDAEVKRLEDVVDREATALEREKQAHDETRRALAAASERADAAIRASELVATALGEAKRRRSGHGPA